MNTNKDITGELKNYIDSADDLAAKNILELLEVKLPSLWFNDEPTYHANEETDMFPSEEKTLSYEQVKQMYPDWFNK